MGADRPGRRSAGELENSVLAALWASQAPLTPAQIQAEVGRSLARTTIATILARLHGKGVVARRRSGRGFAYTPVQDAAGIAAARMRAELEKENDRRTVLARFVSGLDAADEQALRALLDEPDG